MNKDLIYYKSYRNLIINDAILYIVSIFLIIVYKKELLSDYVAWGYSKLKTLVYFIIIYINLFIMTITSIPNYKYLVKNKIEIPSQKKWLSIILPAIIFPIVGVLLGFFIK